MGDFDLLATKEHQAQIFSVTGVTICLGLPHRVSVYTCCLNLIIDSLPFHFQKVPRGGLKSHGHCCHDIVCPWSGHLHADNIASTN